MKKQLLFKSSTYIYFTLFLVLTAHTMTAQYGNVTTLAGDGTQGFSGDGGPATAAVTNFPSGIAIDNTGNIYFSEITNSVVRKIATDGTISTIAGIVGNFGFSGDGGQATAAELDFPQGVAVDASGNIYIADRDNHRIRKVDVATGIITTVAGNGTVGDGGDGSLAINAELDSAQDMVVDNAGNVYISDWLNNKIRKVDANTGIITTIAGTGDSGFSGDGADATLARLKSPSGIALDATGNIFFCDRGNDRVRKIATDGTITTVVGKGGFNAFSGDGGQATDAELNNPSGLTIDNDGNLYVVDRDNHRIRKITTDGIINTIVGTGSTGFSGGGFNGDDQLGPNTLLDKPTDLVIDAAGNVIFNDNDNHRVRKLTNNGTLRVDNFAKIGADMFPNPTSLSAEVTITSQEIINQVTIYNSIGQKLHLANPNKTDFNIPLRNVTSGLYYVKLITENNNSAVQKLIVN